MAIETPMNVADDHLMSVFSAALDCGTAEKRAAYLDGACADRPGLRERVEALLQAHGRGGNFLGGPPDDPMETVTFAPTSVSIGPSSTARAFEEELRRLLRSRLLLVHLLALAGMVLLVTLTIAIPKGPNEEPQPPTISLWLMPLVAFSEPLIGAFVLWRRPGMSLRSLRMWELLFFGAFTAIMGLQRYEWLSWADEIVQRFTRLGIGFFGLASLMPFCGLVLTYGVMIPNTRRQTLLGVAAMSVVPLAVIPPAVAISPALQQGQWLALSLQWAAMMSFPVAIGVFVATRMAALHRRAFDAERRAERIGQYALKRKLGVGGMGEVWLAEHALLKRPCAVKFIRPDLAANPATAARFAREVQAVTGLSHVNTVRVYDYGRADDGSFYFVMEYLDGPTLEELVRTSGPLPPSRVVHLLRQVCGALAEAHASGLIHRDLKPGNVIVAALGGQRDVAKLLDFGLVHDLSAEADDRLTRTGMVLGTPAYMSPEQAAGDPVDARGDVYGLGAVAFYALTGRPPFVGKTARQVLAAVMAEPAPPIDGAPADLAAVVARCLTKDPSDRPPTVRDLERALAGCACATEWTAEQAAAWWATGPAGGTSPPTDTTLRFARQPEA